MQNKNNNKTFQRKTLLNGTEARESFYIVILYCKTKFQGSVVFTTKRSQAEVYTVYFGISSV